MKNWLLRKKRELLDEIEDAKNIIVDNENMIKTIDNLIDEFDDELIEEFDDEDDDDEFIFAGTVSEVKL